MNESTLGPTIEARVISNDRITPENTDEIRQLTLQINDPSFRYVEGQSIGVVVPGPHPFGNPYHLRRYSIAKDLGMNASGSSEFSIMVRRCFYVDEMNGEKYSGIASHYLCDSDIGKSITLNGPFKNPFKVPADSTDNIVMISTGTGIAPFRTFIQQLMGEKGEWQGDVRIFYGAKTGMDLLYMNDEEKDKTNYFDEKTFKAYRNLVNRPLDDESDALEQTIEENAREIWALIQQPNTHVFIAGLKKVSDIFESKLAELNGSTEHWEEMKHKLKKENRYSELMYY